MPDPNGLPPLPPGFVLDTQAATPILPRTPAPQTPAQAEADRLQTQKLRGEIADDQTKRDLKQKATSQHEGYAKSVLGAIDEARNNTSGWSTGLGSVLSVVPSTQAHDLSNNIDTIVANIGFDRLQAMRAESPTGGALGQVSDFENRMLQASLTALRQSQSKDQFSKHLDEVEFHYLNVLNTLEGKPPFKDLNEARKAYGNELAAGRYGMGFGDEKAPDPINPLTPEQQAAYDAFIKANPKAGAEQITNFFGAMGLNPKNAAEVAAAAKGGAGFAPGSEAKFDPDISDVRGKGGVGESIDAIGRAAGNVIPFMDEAAAAGNTIFGDGTFKENLARERAIDQYDWENNTPEAIAGTILGGVAIPTKAPAAYHAARSEALAAGATEQAAHAAAKSAFAKQMAKEGGAYGAAYGAGSEGDLGDRAVAAVTGGAVGAGTGFAGGKAFSPKKPAAASTGPSTDDIGRALQEEGIPAARPVADPTKRGDMAYLETTRGGHNIVRDSLEETRAGIADKVAGLKGAGENKTPGGMGDRIQEAGKGAIQGMRARATRLYDRAANAGADTPIEPKEALATLDRHIADLERNPNTNKGVLAYLKSVRKDFDSKASTPDADTQRMANGIRDYWSFQKGGGHRRKPIQVLVSQDGRITGWAATASEERSGLHNKMREGDRIVRLSPDDEKGLSGIIGGRGKSVADIRDIRTGLNGEINRRNLGKSNAERIMGEVLEAARNDIARDLGKANPDALKLYQQGDELWRQMSTERKQVLERITGPADNPLSGERVMANVRNMMGNRGDLNRFKRVMNMLDPEDRDNFAATLIEGIGQKSPEEPFSPAIFLANTKDMQPEALKAVFGDKGARSIMNLRVASRAFTDAQSSLNNSRSGFVANFKDIVASVSNLRSGGGAALGFMIGGAPGAVAGAVGVEAIQRGLNYLSAKSLMNTEVSQWIRAASKAKTKAEAQGMVKKLGGIASRNPAISQEITGLRDFLVKAANDNLTPKLAAEQSDE